METNSTKTNQAEESYPDYKIMIAPDVDVSAT